MGHYPETHHMHYEEWTDEADIAFSVESIAEPFNETPLGKLMPKRENYLKKVGRTKLEGKG